MVCLDSSRKSISLRFICLTVTVLFFHLSFPPPTWVSSLKIISAFLNTFLHSLNLDFIIFVILEYWSLYCLYHFCFSYSFQVDYCKSFFLNLPSSWTNWLQLVFNAALRAVTKTLKLHLINDLDDECAAQLFYEPFVCDCQQIAEVSQKHNKNLLTG